MKYISTLPFSGLFNWSVQYLNDSNIAFSKAYPMLRIGEILNRNKTAVTIEDDKTYKRVTIRVRNGGVVLRDEVTGENIGTKRQFLVSRGQFILSKIDARNGAMGIIPESLDGAIVTQDFLAYDIDKLRINPQYLVLVSTTKQFIDFCQSCSSGTTNRQRVDEAQFLNIKIPVPSLDEQDKLIDEYYKQVSSANVLLEKAKLEENNLNIYILTQLGIKLPKETISQQEGNSDLLSFVNYKDVDRWDMWSKEHYINNLLNKSIYPITKLGLFDFTVRSWRKNTDRFRYIEMSNIEGQHQTSVDKP